MKIIACTTRNHEMTDFLFACGHPIYIGCSFYCRIYGKNLITNRLRNILNPRIIEMEGEFDD